jgi:hypothetical protein
MVTFFLAALSEEQRAATLFTAECTAKLGEPGVAAMRLLLTRVLGDVMLLWAQPAAPRRLSPAS